MISMARIEGGDGLEEGICIQEGYRGRKGFALGAEKVGTDYQK